MFEGIARIIDRRARLKVYQAERRAMDRLSDVDLADMGIKRYQLGPIARIETFK